MKDVAAALDKMLRIKKLWMKDAYDGYISDQTRGVVKGHRGWSDNMNTINEDLPFPVEELSFVHENGFKFIITSSNDDTTNPPQMQRYWANSIKGAEIMSRPDGWGHIHFTVPGCAADLFKRMLAPKNLLSAKNI